MSYCDDSSPLTVSDIFTVHRICVEERKDLRLRLRPDFHKLAEEIIDSEYSKCERVLSECGNDLRDPKFRKQTDSLKALETAYKQILNIRADQDLHYVQKHIDQIELIPLHPSTERDNELINTIVDAVKKYMQGGVQ